LFVAFTRQTGIPVIARHGDAERIVGDVISNTISPPADVLLTTSVRGVFRAAEEGALRPIDAAATEAVPRQLQDPDGYWVALNYRPAAIAFASDEFTEADAVSFAGLAESTFHGRLCLSTSSDPVNRAVIAALIEELGVRQAELAVRGWMRNLARPVYASQDALWMALADGECAAGIVATAGAEAIAGYAHKSRSLHIPAPRSANIDGIGIARHARNPAGALQLVKWLLDDETNRALAGVRASRPSVAAEGHGKNVGIVAWHAAEAEKLVERARYP